MKSQGKGTEVSSYHCWEGRVENSKMDITYDHSKTY